MRLIGCFGLMLVWNLVVAQTGPGGVGTSATNVLWLSADNGVYSNAGTTPAVNTNNVAQWNDRSGNGKHASHTVPGELPNYQTGVLNGLPVIRFTAGTADRLLSTGVTSANRATVFAVAAWSSLPSANPGIIQASAASAPFGSNGSDKTIGLWVSNGTGNQVWGRGVQSNATPIDIPTTTNTTVNTFYYFQNVYGAASINQFVNNVAAGSSAYNGTLQSWSAFGIGRQATESWNGDIAEVIAYNTTLNSAQQIIVANYISAKYALPLATNDLYTMDNSGYDFDVAGIGYADASNFHNDSKGSGILRVNNPTSLATNGEYLFWGHDNGALQATNTSDIPAGVTARFARVWAVSEAGEVGNVDFQFDVTGLADFTALTTCSASSALRLLVDTNGNGLFSDETPIGNALDMGGNIYKFTAVPSTTIQTGRRFTLALVNASGVEGPGGVGSASPTSLRMWWRGGIGITATGTAISTWADQSGNGNNLTATGGARPVTATSTFLNNQPVVRYSGAQYFTSAFSGPNTNNITLFLVARGTSYQSLFRFQNNSGNFVVYPWEYGGGRTFISSSDGNTGGGINSNLVTSANNVGAARYRRNTTLGMQTYLNGVVAAQRNSVDAILPTEPFFSGIYNPSPSEYPNCDVGEMIGYYTALNDAQMIIVQNYLAAKYDVTLASNDVYTGDNSANGNFDFDVAGIGRVNVTNLHNDARGTGRVRIYNPSNLDDNEYLMWGHDNGSMAINTTNLPGTTPTVMGRFTRTWRVSEINNLSALAADVGDINIQVDLSFVTTPTTASDLVLLIDHNGDGSFSDVGTLTVTGATELSCHNFLFSAVPAASIANGRRFTFGTINITQTPLPITLENFSGTVIEGDAKLSWSTVSEVDNDYFTIERSLNGKDFLPVGEVDGAGTTKIRQVYEFTDPFVPYGKLYYRLKQTDLDLKYTYSELIMLENKPQGLTLIAVPNPSEQGQPLKLRVTRAEPIDMSKAVLSVYDTKGRSIPVTVVPDESGQIQLFFGETHAAGVYMITLRSPELPNVLVTRVMSYGF